MSTTKHAKGAKGEGAAEEMVEGVGKPAQH